MSEALPHILAEISVLLVMLLLASYLFKYLVLVFKNKTITALEDEETRRRANS